ncbi:hypothetical protein O6H91_19G038900 [Diphasiastrum complanatum]|uniref:Uncharacterized protein n=1 Tax=Diphasiastrum complanatum TaxID=34168 RepID=A0ACC2AUB0_DIPCM|nr:hypothetical protein O6H91_19G038900 [Diphasiastrum complanatum]
MPSRSSSLATAAAVAADGSTHGALDAQGKRKQEPLDLQSLRHDVASFAASLGLQPNDQSSLGFNDIDFRRTGPIASESSKIKAGQQKNVAKINLEHQEGHEQTQRREHEHKKKHEHEKQSKIDDNGSKNAKRQKLNKPSSTENDRRKEDRSSDLNPPAKASGLVPNRKEKEAVVHQEGSVGRNVGDSSSRFLSQVCKQVLNSGASEACGSWYEASEKLAARLAPHIVHMTSPGGKNESKHLTRGDGFSQLNQHNRLPFAPTEVFEKKRQEGQHLLNRLMQDYQNHHNKDSANRFLLTARRAGTSADKVAAMTVMIQGNPLANLSTLDTLLGFVTSKGGKRKASLGIDVLKELFLTNLLPGRKLKYLRQQPLMGLTESVEEATLLLYWFWEDCLKERYAKFIHAVVEATKDTLPFLKQKALKTVFELLKAKPEQERTLLSALINKLGDPERKVSSTASYLLSCLLTAHPNMKKIVVVEVESFVFRPNVGLRAKYYAAVFLNQLLLSNRGDGPEVAKQLIDLYFAIFKIITTGEREPGSRLDASITSKSQHINHHHVKKKVKDININGDIKEKEPATTDVEMDSRLLSALLTGVNRAFPYVNNDDANDIIQEHTPMLFRSVHSKNLNVGIQALMLLYQLLLKNQAVSDRFFRALYAILLSEGLAKSSKVEMFLSLVFKAMKSDIDSKRIAAFAKRLMQVALQQPPEFVCGSLILISELLKARPPLWDAVLLPALDDDTEHFLDVEDFENESAVQKNPELLRITTMITEPDGIRSGDDGNNAELRQTDAHSSWKEEQAKSNRYNPRSREPSFCNADRTCWWELSVLALHFHPSVAAMARTLLSGANLVYGGDPLHDLSLGNFLDRFAEKKPKERTKRLDNAHHSSRTPTIVLKLPVEDLAPEDIVFHKFYSSKALRARKPQKQQEADSKLLVGDTPNEDDFLGGDDSDDDEIDALLEQDDAMNFGMLEEGDEADESDLDFESENAFESEEDEVKHDKKQSKKRKKAKKFREVSPIVSDEEIEDEDVLSTFNNVEGNTRKRKKSKRQASQTKDEAGSEDNDVDMEFKQDSKMSGKRMPSANKVKGDTKQRKSKAKITSNIELSKTSPFASAENYAHFLNN